MKNHEAFEKNIIQVCVLLRDAKYILKGNLDRFMNDEDVLDSYGEEELMGFRDIVTDIDESMKNLYGGTVSFAHGIPLE